MIKTESPLVIRIAITNMMMDMPLARLTTTIMNTMQSDTASAVVMRIGKRSQSPKAKTIAQLHFLVCSCAKFHQEPWRCGNHRHNKKHSRKGTGTSPQKGKEI